MVGLRRNNIDAAIAQFQQATGGESDNAMEYLALGEALIRQTLLDWAAADAAAPDNPVAAERALERSLELQPRLASAVIGLGRTRLLEQSYRPGLEKQLEQLWKSHPTRMKIPVTTALMHFRNADRSRALGNLRHAASLSPRPLLLELVREALDLVNLASWNLPPYAKAMEDCLRAVASFRAGAQGKELQAKLTGDDEEMQQLGIHLDAATEYLEALRLAIAAEEKAESEYKKLAAHADDSNGRQMFERLAEEEAIHRKVLDDQYYALSNKGLWLWGD